jgi:hypothetical protein
VSLQCYTNIIHIAGWQNKWENSESWNRFVKWGVIWVCSACSSNKTDRMRTDTGQPPSVSKLWADRVPWLAATGVRCLLHISWSSLTVSRSGSVLSGQYGDDSGASASSPPSSRDSESGAEWFARGKLPYPATHGFIAHSWSQWHDGGLLRTSSLSVSLCAV